MNLFSSFEEVSIGLVVVVLVVVIGVFIFLRNLKMPDDFEKKQEERKNLKEKLEEEKNKEK